MSMQVSGPWEFQYNNIVHLRTTILLATGMLYMHVHVMYVCMYVYVVVLTLHWENPSLKRMISAMRAESGTIMAKGLNMLFKLSGSSVRPALPDFMVMKMPQVGFSCMCLPSNMRVVA